jgi:hypothetical protein
MGIHLLNKLITEKCVGCYKKVHFRDLQFRTIVIDTSIYLYRYKDANTLVDSFYMMCSLFRYYNIQALFVFDGPAPINKKHTIEVREKKKKEAENKYNMLKQQLINTDSTKKSDSYINEIKETMDELRKQFIRITREDIGLIKKILTLYGMSYIDAPSEADALCAYLCIKNKAYGCVSEDSDMFVYGCSKIMHHLSLQNHNVIMYDMNKILQTLSISQKNFIQMCVLSGTDYNTSNNNIFTYYRQLFLFNRSNFIDFILYNYENNKLNKDDMIKYYNICSSFDIINDDILSKFIDVSIQNNKYNRYELIKLLKQYEFYFT